MVSKRRPAKKKGSRRSSKREGSLSASNKMTLVNSKINKESLKKLSRSAKKCVINSKCSDSKNIQKTINDMVNIMTKLASKDFKGAIDSLGIIDMKKMLSAFKDVKAVEKRVQQRRDMRDCITSTCFKELSELMFSLRMYIERSHEGAIGSIMSGLFMIGEETIHEMKTMHKDVYNKVIQGLLHLKQSVGENNTDVVFIKSFIRLMNSFTASEKAILLQYYQLMGKKISENIPELFAIIQEVADIADA